MSTIAAVLKFIGFIKNNFFLQNFAAWILSFASPMVEHNLEKYKAIRKALFLTALEQLEGDYLEFGVFTGSSFVYACRFEKKMREISKHHTRFFGFDSFQGFGNVQDFDKHPFYSDDTFAVNSNRVIQNIKKNTKSSETHLIKGYFETSLRGHTPSELGISLARIVFIDCDLKEPSTDVFNYVKPILQKGTILIMDDFFSYRGDLHLGVSGAFEKFKAENPKITWRRILDYGNGGVAYICSSV